MLKGITSSHAEINQLQQTLTPSQILRIFFVVFLPLPDEKKTMNKNNFLYRTNIQHQKNQLSHTFWCSTQVLE